MTAERQLDGRWPEWMVHYSQLGYTSDLVALDGIGDQPLFQRAGRRILFVLKEPNQQKNTDMRWELRKGPSGPPWHAVARWAACLLAKDVLSYDDAEATKRTALRQVAAINIKKISGGAKSDMADISAVAYRDRKVLREQIQEISPQIIVACGTFAQLVWLLKLDLPAASVDLSAVWSASRDFCVVPFRHPTRSGRSDYYRLAHLGPSLEFPLAQ